MSTASPSVAERVIEIVADEFDKEPSEISVNTNFIADLGAESLDIPELLVTIQERLDVTIPDSEAEQLHTVGETIDCVERLYAAKKTD